MACFSPAHLLARLPCRHTSHDDDMGHSLGCGNAQRESRVSCLKVRLEGARKKEKWKSFGAQAPTNSSLTD